MRVDVKEFEADPERFVELVASVGRLEIVRGEKVVAYLEPAENHCLKDQQR